MPNNTNDREKRTVLLPRLQRPIPMDFQKWVETEAANGWHIQSANLFTLTLSKGEPEQMHCIYDAHDKRDINQHIARQELAGWVLLAKMGTSLIWKRNPHTNAVPSFLDNERLVKVIKRLVFEIVGGFLFGILATMFSIFGCMLLNLYTSSFLWLLLLIPMLAFLCVAIYFGRLLWKLSLRAEEIEEENKKADSGGNPTKQ